MASHPFAVRLRMDGAQQSIANPKRYRSLGGSIQVLVGGGFGGWLGNWLGGGCGVGGGRGCWRDDVGELDFVDFGEVGGDVGVALIGEEILAWGFAVAGIDFVDHFHAFNDFAEGGETHAVETRVVSVVDEELGGAGVWAGGGEDEESALIGLDDWIVVDVGVFPDFVDGGVGAEAELDDESRDDAKEGCVGEVAVADEVVKAVSAEGRPVAMDFDNEVA